jgi:hypothetical protein
LEPNCLNLAEFDCFSGMRNSLQKAPFVKSCLGNTGELQVCDGHHVGTKQAKCKKWLGPTPNGGP